MRTNTSSVLKKFRANNLVPWVLFLFILGIFLIVHLPQALNHDAAWHFQTSFKFLQGDRIGLDVFDINPPMTMWLGTAPAWAVNTFQFDQAMSFKLYFIAICLGIGFVCRHLLKACRWSGIRTNWFLVFLAAILLVLPGYDFAQREQFVSLLILPYLICAFMRMKGIQANWLLLCFVGIIAGVGIGIKPYFLLLPIFVELWLMFKTRGIMSLVKPEPIALFITLIVYVCLVFFVTPDYLFKVVPAAISNYAGFKTPWSEFSMFVMQILFLPVLLLSCSFVFLRRVSEFSSLLLIAAVAFLVAAILQQKSWGYQFYPVLFFLYLSVLINLFELANDFENKSLIMIVLCGATCIGILQPFFLFAIDSNDENGTASRVSELSKTIGEHAGADRKVFAFITSPRDIHPAILDANAEWVGNAGAQVFLPALLALGEKQNTETVEKVHEVSRKHDFETLKLIISKQPGVLIFDEGKRRLAISNPDFDYIDHYSAYPEFAEFMKSYQRLKRVGKFAVYIRSDG